ncbi:meiotic cohesin complex subunit Rec11 [Schizosaccharomyces japonicus yFS275]|uniref:Meiotic cohesin complex subunit Rec11 n=1 Tax=Schizosaccharomyces japonicus (strain yFS275 / FY16936) TaxID=402676 RepID=B6K4Y3_SCHJY|nr:meiotic cohesin complex subunit Rec11 [Schizosaccharomyces japonicus yFS275]EEB08540.1 meiotic cohesin complex subunit Rec11 [Schizosaccharomyces japonicus yFS275]
MLLNFDSDGSSHYEAYITDDEGTILSNLGLNSNYDGQFSEESSFIDSDGNEEEEEEEQLTRSKKKNSRKSLKRSLTLEYIPEEPKENTSLLFRYLEDEHLSPYQLSQLLAIYEGRYEALLLEFLNFILQCCGCTGELNQFDIQDCDSIPQTLSQLEESRFDKLLVHRTEYLLIQNERKPSYRNLLKSFLGKFIRVGVSESEMFEQAFISSLVNWLVCLSSNKWIAIRHTATMLCITIAQTLCEIHKCEPAANTSEGSFSAVTSEEPFYELVEQVFDSVVVLRLRDQRPVIRLECVKALSAGFLSSYVIFSEPRNLKYMDRSFFDSDVRIRKQALDFVQQYLDKHREQELPNGFDLFLERIYSSLMNISLYETDSGAQITAIKIWYSLMKRSGHAITWLPQLYPLFLIPSKIVLQQMGKILHLQATVCIDNVFRELGGSRLVQTKLKKAHLTIAPRTLREYFTAIAAFQAMLQPFQNALEQDNDDALAYGVSPLSGGRECLRNSNTTLFRQLNRVFATIDTCFSESKLPDMLPDVLLFDFDELCQTFSEFSELNPSMACRTFISLYLFHRARLDQKRGTHHRKLKANEKENRIPKTRSCSCVLKKLPALLRKFRESPALCTILIGVLFQYRNDLSDDLTAFYDAAVDEVARIFELSTNQELLIACCLIFSNGSKQNNQNEYCLREGKLQYMADSLISQCEEDLKNLDDDSSHRLATKLSVTEAILPLLYRNIQMEDLVAWQLSCLCSEEMHNQTQETQINSVSSSILALTKLDMLIHLADSDASIYLQEDTMVHAVHTYRDLKDEHGLHVLLRLCFAQSLEPDGLKYETLNLEIRKTLTTNAFSTLFRACVCIYTIPQMMITKDFAGVLKNIESNILWQNLMHWADKPETITEKDELDESGETNIHKLELQHLKEQLNGTNEVIYLNEMIRKFDTTMRKIVQIGTD